MQNRDELIYILQMPHVRGTIIAVKSVEQCPAGIIRNMCDTEGVSRCALAFNSSIELRLHVAKQLVMLGCLRGGSHV